MCSILFGGYILNGVELQGIERLLKRSMLDFYYYIYPVPIIPTCLTFQMCYIFRRKTKIMLMCSFIPCMFVVLSGLHYAFFGGQFFGDTLYYGFEGFVIGIFFGGLICYVKGFPLLPICLIFQIGYLINRKILKYGALNE